MKHHVLPGTQDAETKTARAAGEGYRSGVRESMARLPGWLQPLLTFITGKPLAHEKPSIAPAPLANFWISLTALFLSIDASLYLLETTAYWGFVVLLPTWMIATGMLRKMQVVFAHHAVHRTFIPNNPGANEFALNVFVTIPLAQNSNEYRADHFGHHSRALFTTLKDADAAFLDKLGFQPGLSKAALWRRLFVVLILPRFHALFLAGRFRSNFVTRPIGWRMASIVWFCAITFGLCAVATWWHVALAVWLPFFVLYHVSALLQFITEHAWMLSKEAPAGVDAYADRCWGRFVGEPCPSCDAGRAPGLGEWGRWWARMVLVHAPVRFGCLVGDLPAHDWHHLCGYLRQSSSLWPVAIFARQTAIDRGNSMGMEKRELWSLHSMLDHVFSALEHAQYEVAVKAASNRRLNYAARDVQCQDCLGMTIFRCRQLAHEFQSRLYFCTCCRTSNLAFDAS